jgi:ADP-heptose:LPS heptosyltransferase
VRRVLIVRLRSIGDTVLATPCCTLRRFLPHAKIDILLEDWVVPVLTGSRSDRSSHRLTPRQQSPTRARCEANTFANRYDVVYNLHGGTTATFLTWATGAKHRVGFGHYQYARLHNHVAPSSLEIWQRPTLHSVEQQLALIGWTGVPVTDRPPTRLAVTEGGLGSVNNKLRLIGFEDFHAGKFALLHPAAAFDTKQWAAEKFAKAAAYLHERGLTPIAIVSAKETATLEALKNSSPVHIFGLNNLTLPEVTALSSRAQLFVGNDSGIAHIAAATGTPCVVIFGSSNRNHWRPWTRQPNEIVFEEMPCQPCPGYFCAEFEKPECILRVPAERVVAAIDRVLKQTEPNQP